MLCLEMKVKFTLVEVEDGSFRLSFLILQEKPQIWRFSENDISIVWKLFLFICNISKHYFLGLFRPKIITDEISIFGLNPWVNQLFWKNHKYGDSGKTTIRESPRPKTNTISSVF